mgnify:CR=1 FL=1
MLQVVLRHTGRHMLMLGYVTQSQTRLACCTMYHCCTGLKCCGRAHECDRPVQETSGTGSAQKRHKLWRVRFNLAIGLAKGMWNQSGSWECSWDTQPVKYPSQSRAQKHHRIRSITDMRKSQGSCCSNKQHYDSAPPCAHVVVPCAVSPC